jgi:hypothetical protein
MKRWIAIGILVAFCFGLFCTLGSTSDELDLARAKLNSMQAELDSVKAQLASTQDEIETTKEELADLQVSYNGLLSGHGYTIKDPTYKQMMSFIREDETDKRRYIEGEYVCENFAMDICNNAEEKGIRCAYAMIAFLEGGHAIVAFNTIDRGLIYIEPQYDDIVNPVIGKHYYKCVITKPGHYYEKPDYDDTIEKILVVW